MGTSTSWIAVEGATLEQVARDLHLTPASADPTEAPGEDNEYQAAMLPTGWVLLVCRMKRNGVVADPEVLKELSSSHRIVGCDEESHVMYSASCEWRAGRELWSVIHSSEEAATHLAARGDLPTGWPATRDEGMAVQAEAVKAGEDVDYVYEIPLAVAKQVVGYRLESDDDDDLEYVTLVAASPQTAPRQSKPWWRFW